MNKEVIEKKVIDILKMIYDPEIPVNIYDLGLIYKIEFIETDASALYCKITMTLTSPACPVSEMLFSQVSDISKMVDEIDETIVNIVFDPPWNQDKMSYEAKLALGML